MAPHHGSKISNTDELRLWANPQLVISSEGKPRGTKPENPYQKERIPYWTTHEHGAITLHSHRSGLVAETFLTHQRMAIRSRK
jgi:beta-lactamase superfamily II metal-dependent hydrolase